MYRLLTTQEIKTLELRGCLAEDWTKIEVNDPFNAGRLRNVKFGGNIRLGANSGLTKFNELISKQSGITNCFIQDSVIGNDVYLSDIGILVNYKIGDGSFISNTGTIAVFGSTAFGNGHEINILNENGGRKLPVFDRLSAQIAYMLVVYRHNPQFINKLKSLITDYINTKIATTGEIGEYCRIQNTKNIINVNISPFCQIEGALNLEEGTIKCNEKAPVHIGGGVIAKHFIILSGSNIDNGAILNSTFVGQGVQVGNQFSSDNSAFFANCEAFHGEACSIFAGPYTVTHHKSTLLIAGMFSFYNAGSGTNQSNHMYKLGPVHQGIVERGSKTGSFSYMLWPTRVGSFTVVMDKHTGNFDSSEFPFSYISAENGKSVIIPAMNLFTVGTARDSKKWPARDNRKDDEKTDIINYDLFNPCTIQKMIQGSSTLEKLYQTAANDREFIYHKGLYINRLMLRTSKRFYELAVYTNLYGVLIKKATDQNFNTIDELQKILRPSDSNASISDWVDIAGMITDKDSLKRIIGAVIDGKIKNIDDLSLEFNNCNKDYEDKAYSWCISTLNKLKGIDVSSISKSGMLELSENWKTGSVKCNNMILKDAEKEFDQYSRIGFGLEGDENEKLADFESVRGSYEKNSFISEIRRESEKIEEIYSKLVEKIQALQV